MEENLYYCTESEQLFTESDLAKCMEISKADGDEFATGNLAEYINACLVENNGTLEKVKKIRSTYYKGIEIFSEWNIKTDLF